jgi:hypothetical protein
LNATLETLKPAKTLNHQDVLNKLLAVSEEVEPKTSNQQIEVIKGGVVHEKLSTKTLNLLLKALVGDEDVVRGLSALTHQ